MQIPKFVIMALGFAVVFPALTWAFNRKHFTWTNMLIAVVGFAICAALLV